MWFYSAAVAVVALIQLARVLCAGERLPFYILTAEQLEKCTLKINFKIDTQERF